MILCEIPSILKVSVYHRRNRGSIFLLVFFQVHFTSLLFVLTAVYTMPETDTTSHIL